MHRCSPVLSLLFAGFIAFLPPDLLPHLSSRESSNRLPETPILAVGLPPAPAVIAASRAQQTWASAPAKQSGPHALTGIFSVQPESNLPDGAAGSNLIIPYSYTKLVTIAIALLHTPTLAKTDIF
jgi:hypothetical protein